MVWAAGADERAAGRFAAFLAAGFLAAFLATGFFAGAAFFATAAFLAGALHQTLVHILIAGLQQAGRAIKGNHRQRTADLRQQRGHRH